LKTSAVSEPLTRRIIACLDVDAGRVVKGIQFEQLRDAGDPAELASLHAEAGADEIVMLDITASVEGRKTLRASVRAVNRQIFIPFTVGGGIRTLADAAAVFEAGADKVAINSAAIASPELISEIAARFGSQAVVVAIDAKRTTENPFTAEFAENAEGRREKPKTGFLDRDRAPLTAHDAKENQNGVRRLAEVFVHGGRKPTGKDAVAWAREAEDRGAGEILLTSMDRDGTGLGFDCPLTAAISEAVSIPVIASGGAGRAQHFIEVFTEGKADAALAASIFHFGTHAVAELKQTLSDAGIPMRWPC
jgi:cyclase